MDTRPPNSVKETFFIQESTCLEKKVVVLEVLINLILLFIDLHIYSGDGQTRLPFLLSDLMGSKSANIYMFCNTEGENVFFLTFSNYP